MTLRTAPAITRPIGPDRQRDRLICALGCLLFTMGGGILYVQPAFSAAFTDALKLTAREVGIVDSLEIASFIVAAIVMAIAPDRFSLRLMAVSVMTVAGGNLLSGFMPNVYALAATRFVTGLIGEGPLIAYSFVILGRMARPEWGFGAAQTFLALSGTIALQPSLQLPFAGYSSSLFLFAMLAVPAIGLLSAVVKLSDVVSLDGGRYPATGLISEPGIKAHLWESGSITLRLLTGQAIWAAAPGLLWPFTAQMASRSGLGEPVVMVALSMSTIFGLSGIVIPAILGKTMNYRSAIVAASMGLAVAACLIYLASSLLALAAGFALFIIFWNMGQIYQPALLISVDQSGRGASLISVVQLIGMAAGTALGGLAIHHWGILAIPLSCISALALSTPFFLMRFPGQSGQRFIAEQAEMHNG